MPRVTCPACFRPIAYCYCSRLHAIANSWPVFILQDVREAGHPIGTARIASLSLNLVEMVTLDPDRPDSAPDLLNNAFHRPLRNPALIYPGAGARQVSELGPDSAFTEAAQGLRSDLLFIDADWGRSLRMLKVFPALAALPTFMLDGLPISRYRIRKQPTPDAVSTLEAIVHTLNQLEPEAGSSAMLSTMDWMIDQQIKRMGDNTFQHNYSASP
ncbi:tRNA-uridine aminocarboxypropyltransferase [Pseudohongiella acticola]|jgi:tRNA-uridine aminocarboxypropyltransferase|uniref:tRNA-uridine aminocarboxypropyltransferase n=1 Tax=Pseudohongiella acticola TaxID=1524254 RepID=UPI0030EB4F0A